MRKILIVVDMQNDFIDGALGTEEAVAIVPAVIDKIRSYPVENIIATRDTHQEDYLDSQEGKYLPVKHCIKGTKGWQIKESVAAALGAAEVIDKPTFGSVSLAQKLVGMNQEEPVEIEMVGLCTDICVVSNALAIKAFLPEVKITVDEKCCAGVTQKSHEAAITTMKSCQIQVKQ